MPRNVPLKKVLLRRRLGHLVAYPISIANEDQLDNKILLRVVLCRTYQSWRLRTQIMVMGPIQWCVLPQIKLIKTDADADIGSDSDSQTSKPSIQEILGLKKKYDEWQYFRVSPRSYLPSNLQMDVLRAMTACGVNYSRAFSEQPPSVITKVIERVTSTSVSVNNRSKRSIPTTPERSSRCISAKSL